MNIDVPDTGLPTDVLYRRFFKEVDKKDQTIIIVLDEIDALVRKIGGLNDSITKFEPASKEGNGFVFRTYNAHEMLHELKRGVKIYKKNKEAWDQLVKNAFKSKFSWDKSAEEYIELYNKL